MSIRVAVAGATGKLGRVAVSVIRAADDFQVVAELNSHSSFDEMLGADVLVDMTLPHVSPEIVTFALEHDLRVLVGTSGWSKERILSLRPLLEQHRERGVVIIPNFSLGSALATALSTVAARFFDSIEIIEAHGETKRDSPSGTAVRTAELIGDVRARISPPRAPHTDQRARGQQVAGIPVHSLRMSGVVAQQSVAFGGNGEALTIRHDTVSSSAYEAGILLALRAATTTTGIRVGLESLLDLGIAEPPSDLWPTGVRETSEV